MLRILFASLLFAQAAYAYEDLDAYNEKEIVVHTKRIDLPDFPGSFNPSIIRFDADSYLLTFRFSPDPHEDYCISYLGAALLDKNFDFLTEPRLLNTRSRGSVNPSHAEDPRIFSYRGRFFLLYNDNIEQPMLALSDRRDMFMAELIRRNENFVLSSPLKLVCDEKLYRQRWEKNWIPFEWNKTLLLAYSIQPHEILYPNLTSGACYTCYYSQGEIEWDWGTLRGSSAAILVDGEYLAFFHSGRKLVSEVSWGWELWHYFMGAYTFAPEPPFQLTRISPEPISAEGFYTKSNYAKRVIFPGGFVVEGDEIHVAYGKDDCEVWIATLNKKKLFESLVPVKTVP